MSDEGGSVGIVWAVPVRDGTQLVIEASGLANAEPYGDKLTHSNGHYEAWSAWQRIGLSGLARRGLPAAIASHEYEDLPRGRVVFSVPDAAFTVYGDRRLLEPAMLARILAAFRLPPTGTTWRTDPHYRTNPGSMP
jgi:hypothetical protein